MFTIGEIMIENFFCTKIITVPHLNQDVPFLFDIDFLFFMALFFQQNNYLEVHFSFLAHTSRHW